jgi:hypothetical protein
MADEPIEWDALSLAQRADLSRNAPGPDLSREACACGKFGPWGVEGIFYCEEHVPPQHYYAGQFLKETMDDDDDA